MHVVCVVKNAKRLNVGLHLGGLNDLGLDEEVMDRLKHLHREAMSGREQRGAVHRVVHDWHSIVRVPWQLRRL